MKLSLLTKVSFLSLLFFTANYAFALTASPVKVEITGDPGQTLSGEIELLNEQNEQKVLFTSFENFEPAGDTGAPRFIGSQDGLATWLSAQQSVTVDPEQKVVVPYSITIPQNAEPGGYFAAVFFGAQDPKGQGAGEVAIGGKLGILILLRVSGNIVENAGVTAFGADTGSRIFTDLPINFSYKFTNSGGDRVVPLGDITIKNTFGMVSASLLANKNEGSVLPNSGRTFSSAWGEYVKDAPKKSFFESAHSQFSNFHIGLYRAHLAVVYGTTNQSASHSFTFFVFPWQFLSLCFVALVCAYFFLRKYNAWIISKSKSNA
jgi:hypothetical protein